MSKSGLDECGLRQSIEKMLPGRRWIAEEFAVSTSQMESHPHLING